MADDRTTTRTAPRPDAEASGTPPPAAAADPRLPASGGPRELPPAGGTSAPRVGAVNGAVPRAAPRSPEEARAAIAGTRDRISGTLDQIEQRLREKGRELQEKADVPGRLRELVRGRELPALLVAVGAGFVLALVLKGRRGGPVTLSAEEADALRRWRKDRARVLRSLDRCGRTLERLAAGESDR